MSLPEFWNCQPWELEAAVFEWNRRQERNDGPEPMTADRYDELLKEKGYRVH